jgi:hypothetical protein
VSPAKKIIIESDTCCQAHAIITEIKAVEGSASQSLVRASLPIALKKIFIKPKSKRYIQNQIKPTTTSESAKGKKKIDFMVIWVAMAQFD